MTQLRHAEGEIERAGARLVVVGNGAPHFISGFRDKTGFAGALYTDPELRTYRALELTRSVRSSFNLRSARRAWTALTGGARQTRPLGKPLGDAWQQGGVCVISTRGELVYRYASGFAGDHPPVAELISAAERAAS